MRLPIPADLLSDGVQTFVLRDAAGDTTLAHFTIVTGMALEEDIRAEVDLRAHCERHPLARRLADQALQVERLGHDGCLGRAVGAGQREQLRRHARRARGAGIEPLQGVVHLGRVRCGQGQLGLVLQRCERRAQLVRRVGQKGLLRERALAHPAEQAVHRIDQRMHFAGGAGRVDRAQVIERARADLRAQQLQRAQGLAGGQHDGEQARQRERHHADERADQCLPPHLLALDLCLADAHLAYRLATRHAARDHAHRGAVDLGLEKYRRVGGEREARFTQRRVAGHLPAVGSEDGVVDAVGLIGAQRTFGLRVHVEGDRIALPAHEARDRDRGVAQRLVESLARGLQHQCVLQRGCRRHDRQHRHQHP